MDLLVIRHAIAEDRDRWAESGAEDAARPLTDEGIRKMQRGARALPELVPGVRIVASSPYRRAWQTAEIVARRYGVDEIEPLDALIPEAPPTRVVTWLRACEAQDGPVAIVGHEPHLSRLVTYLVCGARDSRIELKKGAAVLLRIDRRTGAGSATLLWALAPRQLRRCAEKD